MICGSRRKDGKMNKTRKIGVVLVTPHQTGANTYTDVFRTVEIEIPNDGNDWHVAGEDYNITEEQKDGG